MIHIKYSSLENYNSDTIEAYRNLITKAVADAYFEEHHMMLSYNDIIISLHSADEIQIMLFLRPAYTVDRKAHCDENILIRHINKALAIKSIKCHFCGGGALENSTHVLADLKDDKGHKFNFCKSCRPLVEDEMKRFKISNAIEKILSRKGLPTIKDMM